MSFTVIGAGMPLQRPPIDFQSLEFLTQPSPVEPEGIETTIVEDDKDYQIELLKNQVAMLKSENARLRQIIKNIVD